VVLPEAEKYQAEHQPMINRRKRRDSNHKSVVDAFKAFGWSVLDTSQCGEGAPDLIVAKNYWGIVRPADPMAPAGEADYVRVPRVLAVEVKTPKGKVKPHQAEWMQMWQGEYVVVRSPEDVAALSREG
jgi:hypothetical protein